MRCHFRSRKGVSSAVVTAMLLTGTTVLGIALVSWSHSIVTSTEYVLATSVSNKSNTLSEYLTIENVWFRHHYPTGSNSLPYMNITLTNVGNIGVTVYQIKFNNTCMAQSTCPVPTALGKIIPGNFTFVQPQISWHNGSSTNMSVITTRGSIFTTVVKP